jgi:hypothetical protein
LVLAIPALAGAQTAYESTTLTDTPRIFWYGSEASGSIINHGSDGSGKDLAAGTAPSYSQAGVNGARGNSLLFTAASSQFMHANANDSGNGPGDLGADKTFECWLNVAGTSAGMAMSAGSAESGTATGRVWQLGNDEAPLRAHSCFFDTNGSSSYNCITGGTTITAGSWYLVSTTWVISTFSHILYLNGVSDGTSSTHGGTGAVDSVQWWALGRKEGDDDTYFNGNVQDCATFTSAHSASKILTRYQLGISTAAGRRIFQSHMDLPSFRDNNYLAMLLNGGYLTDEIRTEPQHFGPYPTLALVPRGDTGKIRRLQ